MMCALKCKIILIYQNEAMGISVHCVVYEARAFPVSFAIQGRFLAPQTTFPFSRLVQFIECFH